MFVLRTVSICITALSQANPVLATNRKKGETSPSTQQNVLSHIVPRRMNFVSQIQGNFSPGFQDVRHF